ncbi:MAG: transposase [Candidatus Methanomethylicaceae archaeon]
MNQRKWTPEEKLSIVMEGLKEKKSVADICREHQISQTLYYRWRDKFLEGGKKALTNGSPDDKAYKAEIERLQKIIGKRAIQIEILKNRGAIHDKVVTVNMFRESGYRVKDIYNALGISISGYYSSSKSRQRNSSDKEIIDKVLLDRIKAIKAEHPFWGYRRVRA